MCYSHLLGLFGLKLVILSPGNPPAFFADSSSCSSLSFLDRSSMFSILFLWSISFSFFFYFVEGCLKYLLTFVLRVWFLLFYF